MSIPRSLYAFLVVLLAAGALTLTGLQGAHATADPCQQAVSTLTYTYASGATVPEGALASDAAQSDSVFGPNAGQPGCQDFTNRLDARKTTLTSTDVTTTVKVLVTGFDLATVSAGQCSAVVDGQSVPMQVIPDSNGTTATLATGTDPSGDLTLPYTGSFSGYTVDVPVTIPVTVDCGALGVFHPDLVVNATPEPSGTSLSISTTASRTLTASRVRHHASVSGTEVSGRLTAAKAGFSVGGQTVIIQHKVDGTWSKIATDTTGTYGHYDVVVSDTTHPLRAKFNANLRLLHSYSAAS